MLPTFLSTNVSRKKEDDYYIKFNLLRQTCKLYCTCKKKKTATIIYWSHVTEHKEAAWSQHKQSIDDRELSLRGYPGSLALDKHTKNLFNAYFIRVVLKIQPLPDLQCMLKQRGWANTINHTTHPRYTYFPEVAIKILSSFAKYTQHRS